MSLWHCVAGRLQAVCSWPKLFRPVGMLLGTMTSKRSTVHLKKKKKTAPHEVSKDAVISPVTSELLHRMQWMSLKLTQLYSYQGLRRTQGLLYQKYLCGKTTMAPDATVTFKPQYFTVALRKHDRIYVWQAAKEVEVHCWFGNNFSDGLALCRSLFSVYSFKEEIGFLWWRRYFCVRQEAAGSVQPGK